MMFPFLQHILIFPKARMFLTPLIQRATISEFNYIALFAYRLTFFSDIIGISFVTFDSTSGSSGTATPRIFVGVANKGADNIFVSEDSGSTCKRLETA